MLKKRGIGIDVVSAAKMRIIDTFTKGRPVWLSFSGGKDSIVLADILYNLIVAGKIDKSLLTVIFFDEEAMYEEVINIVKAWRLKFMSIGVKFIWYCIQVKHYDCLNTLSNEETFICWDKDKKDVWVRQPPKFAVMDDEWLIPYKDNYQSFNDRKMAAYNVISMRGVRVSESIQRMKNIAKTKSDDISLPIYDMTDKDIWLYILKYNIEIPAVYENLYRVGTAKNNLRISQFFSIDTARSLVKLGEIYPDLMERVTRREPNAYLACMYWDSEMFGRSTKKRRELEEEKKDYKKLCYEIIRSENPEHPKQVRAIKPYVTQYANLIEERTWQHIYNLFVLGDPKGRQTRAVILEIVKFRKRQLEEG